MSNINMEAQVKELMNLKRMKEELEAEIKAAEDAIKEVMGEEEILNAGAFKVTWKPVTTNRLDTKGLTAFFGKDALEPFYKASTVRRFVIA